jgi:hypothetical protein
LTNFFSQISPRHLAHPRCITKKSNTASLGPWTPVVALDIALNSYSAPAAGGTSTFRERFPANDVRFGCDHRPIPEASDSVSQLRERRYQCSLGGSGQWVCRRSNL